MTPPDWNATFQHTLERLLHHDTVVVVLDNDYRILSFNHGAEKLFGCRAQDVIGMNYPERFLPEGARKLVQTQIDRNFEGQEVRAFENEVIAHDGIRVATWDAVGIRDSSGNVVGLMAMGRDVTARRHTERRLAESEARLRWLTNAIPGAAFIMMEAGGRPVVPMVTDGIQHLLRLTPKQIQSDTRRVFTQIHAQDREGVRDGMVAAWQDKSSWRQDFRTVDGRWLRGQAEPHTQEDGTPIWVGLVTDITPQKNMESRLQQASRLSALGNLAAGVAHELNNPLAYVSANLGYAMEIIGTLPQHGEIPEVMQALQDAVDGAERMRDIVADLKSLARPDDTSEGPVDVQSVWSQAIRMARHGLTQRAQLTESGPIDARVHGNHSRLVQALLSLLLHAASRLPRDQRHAIRLRAERREKEVVLEVEDNGPPIPPSHLEHLFDPWFNAAPDGSGLHLALCHATIRSGNGRIEVESIPGRTVFRVLLPTL